MRSTPPFRSYDPLPEGIPSAERTGPLRVLVSCEHGGNRVPRRYTSLFREARPALDSHRGWDPGALTLARQLARVLDAPLRFAVTTRLLVDLNRSPGNPTLFSEFSRELPAEHQTELLRRYHDRHRRRIRRAVEPWALGGATVLHLGIHTFTARLEEWERDVDVGVLFQPFRPLERAFSRLWGAELRAALPGLRIRPNEPYHGGDDGLTTTLRDRYPPEAYLGIELEVSQAIAARDGPLRRRVFAGIRNAAERAVDRFGRSLAREREAGGSEGARAGR